MLTPQRARELVHYDPATGIFRWRFTRQRATGGKILGCLDNKGYRRMKVDGQFCKAHRLAWLVVYGEWPPGQIDHIDGNRDNNAIANLRLATSEQNAANRRAARTNTSGFKGVVKFGDRWRAQTRRKGRHISLGYYATKQEAADAFIAFATRFDGAFACLEMRAGEGVNND